MPVKVKPKAENPNLTPSKEIDVFITCKATDRRFRVLIYDEPTGKMLLQNELRRNFETHWKPEYVEKYIVTYTLRHN